MPGGIHPPLEVFLSWPKPNYVDPDTRPKTILILTCILGPMTVALSFARLWVRIRHQRNPNWDDWLMVVATVPMIALTILFPIAAQNGFDRHLWDINLFGDSQKVVTSRKYVLAVEMIFCPATGLVKISILLFYRRLGSKVVSKTFRWVTWASIGFIAAYTIALTLAPILGCQPLSAFWDQVDPVKKLKGDYKYHCFNEGADVLAASIISTVQDFITALLPTFLYWNLQIPIRQKVALFGIFAIGYGVSALGALRSYYSWYVFYGTYDVTWATWDLFLVTMLEMHIGAFCANAPALKVFFTYFFHNKLASRFGTPMNSKDRKDSGHTNSKSSTSQRVLQRMGTFLAHGTSSRNRDGYFSESNGGVVVDHLGGVKVEKEIEITHSTISSVDKSPANNGHGTINISYDHYYEDIEMGRFESTEIPSGSSTRSLDIVDDEILEALPPLPLSPMNYKSVIPVKYLPRSPMVKELPKSPVAGPVGAERRKNSVGISPFPPRTTSAVKPSWQSWT